MTGIWKILFVDDSDALKSGLPKFPINPEGNPKIRCQNKKQNSSDENCVHSY
jgi:hypothetical protein